MKNLIIMYSGTGSTASAIIDVVKKYSDEVKIWLVSDKMNAAAAQMLINQHGIRTAVIQQKRGEKREKYCQVLIDYLGSVNPDLIVLAGFMKVLTPNIVRRFNNKIINIHPSLLPKYPGLNTYDRVIESGDGRHGFTVHYVDDGVDTGEHIFQWSFDFDTATTSKEDLIEWTKEGEKRYYPNIIRDLILR